MRSPQLARTAFLVVMVLCFSGTLPVSARAGSILGISYTGTIIELEDTFGVFSGVALGDAASGILKYSNPAPLADYDALFGTLGGISVEILDANGDFVELAGYYLSIDSTAVVPRTIDRLGHEPWPDAG